MPWGRSTRREPTGRSPDDRVVAVVEAHAADVLASLQRRTESPEDAADLLGETLLVAWRRAGELPQADEPVRMWLFVTARQALANHRRGRRRAGDLSARLRGELAAELRTARSGAHDHVADAVRDAVEALPAAQRELVELLHGEGVSLAQAVEMSGVPASTARSRYSRARASLTRSLVGAPATRRGPAPGSAPPAVVSR